MYHAPPQAFGFQAAPHQWISRSDSADKVIVCERGDLVFVFNFHPTKSYTDYRVGCNASGPYKVGVWERKGRACSSYNALPNAHRHGPQRPREGRPCCHPTTTPPYPIHAQKYRRPITLPH